MKDQKVISYNKRWENCMLEERDEILEEYMHDKWIIAVMNHSGTLNYYLVNNINSIGESETKELTTPDEARAVSGEFAATMSVYGFASIILIGIECIRNPHEIKVDENEDINERLNNMSQGKQS